MCLLIKRCSDCGFFTSAVSELCQELSTRQGSQELGVFLPPHPPLLVGNRIPTHTAVTDGEGGRSSERTLLLWTLELECNTIKEQCRKCRLGFTVLVSQFSLIINYMAHPRNVIIYNTTPYRHNK